MLQAHVNNKKFEIELSPNGVTINTNAIVWDLIELKKGHFHILYHNKSYRAEIVNADTRTKSVTLKINNHRYTVDVKDKFDLLLEKMGIADGATSKVNTIKAPMPGLVVDLKISEGDQVKTGDTLIILEAMKMENSIKAPADGVVKKITVKKGDRVEKNQLLIEF